MSRAEMSRLVALVVAVVGLGTLGTTALHANQHETTLTSAHNVALAERSNAYYDCLSAQAHSLIGRHDVVFLPKPSLGEWATLTKVVGGWANLTLRLSTANEAISIQRSKDPGTCDGDVLVVIIRLPDGHIVIKRGLQETR